MLYWKQLTKRYKGQMVLESYSGQWLVDEHLLLMGPSGRGKTTLVRLLLGLELPDAGVIERPMSFRPAVVFQEDRLLEAFTAYDNLRFVAPTLTMAKAEEVLTALALPRRHWQQPVSQYSGGMKRRVAIARALVAEGDCLFLDEPFKGLDRDTLTQVKSTLRQYAQHLPLFIISHQEADVDFLPQVRRLSL